jgi:putative transposase
VLIAAIRVAHTASRGTYGAPRVHAELAAKGISVGCKRVARLMTQAGLAGVSRRKFVVTTVKDGGRQAPDLVERNFTAEAPDRLWVADITYIPTWAGFLYLAVVLDAFSRRIVGWSMATTLAKQLVLDALNMALATRRPRQVIHHSDQGSQYTSIEFGRRCRDAGVRPSMGSVGDAYDNAMCESFFATLECELLARSRFKTQAEARHAIFEFVEGFYNLRRRHSSIGYLSPVDYERRHPATRSIPTHTSLPSCSRPSRTSPSGGPKTGPSWTAAVRDGRTIVRVGTEEWLRQGPNQRMPRNGRATCRQIR